MLFELQIKDFILIRQAQIEFKEGFNVITGETGAGKSMILGAIELVMGGQASREVIRIGAESAFVRATFFTTEPANALLIEWGFPTDEGVLQISREIQQKGKNLSRINGQIATLNQVKTLSEHLIHLHGQNDNQQLFLKGEQLALLDAEIDGSVLSAVASEFERMDAIEKELTELEEKRRDSNRRMDFLSFQVDEIEAASLKSGEDDALEQEFDFARHAEKISEVIEGAESWLTGAYDEGATSTASSLAGQMDRLVSYDARLESFAQRFKELFYLMDDLSKDVDRYKASLETDPERLDTIGRRLDQINSLKSKYGKTIDEILAFADRASEELSGLRQIDETIETLQRAYQEVSAAYMRDAVTLSAARKASAESLEKALMTQFAELNMPQAKLKIELENGKPTTHGVDEVDFTISTNAGQPFRSLKKVVSGGELSRIMLGIKIVQGHRDAIPSLIFDEIDAGISGITANVVGEKLYALGRYSQVICITHLPQIAVFGDRHFVINKKSEDDLTETEIRALENEQIVGEIARLVGGMEMTETTKKHAIEMLNYADKIKSHRG
jgi:DNA repair protein RecN (Recombination protein N)